MLKLVSFNLRVDTAIDGENRFNHRKEAIVAYLDKQAADIYGFQEVLPHVNDYLTKNMPLYSMIGLSRSDGDEACPIYYRNDSVKLIDHGTFWLSMTPKQVSKIEGSHYVRIASYIVFSHKHSDPIVFVNTHLDYASDEISHKQVKILLEQSKSISNSHQASLIIGGDFNQTFGSNTINQLAKDDLISIYHNLENPGVTYHGFGKIVSGLPIDHLFYDPKITLSTCQIDSQCYNDRWLSDHFPVIANFFLRK
jgi:endonuclease/exonuclease/phosphatase family metal-dependent hydrolase